MDLAHMTLRAALATPWWRWGLALAAGIAGILGLGLMASALPRRAPHGSSLAASYLEGSVLTAALLALSSAATGALRSWPVAVLGILAGVVALRRRGVGPDLVRELRPLPWICLAFVLFLPRLIGAPMPKSDLTAIWTFHAKALALEPLLHPWYVTEPVWAGSHPEYPLYLPLLHAHFFSLAQSFRDDLVRVWQAVLLVAFAVVLWNGWRDRGRLAATAAIAGLLALVAAPGAGLAHGFVELPSAIFAGFAGLALLRRDFARLPIALAGLAACKNEGLVGAWLILLLAAATSGRRRDARGPLIASALALGVLTALAASLPSPHENYPARFRDLGAWRDGFSHLEELALGFGRRLVGWPWGAAFVLLPIAFVSSVRRRDAALPLLAFGLVMPLVFLAVYVVSPWGTTLLDVTAARLAAQIFLPAWFGVLAVLLPAGARALARWRHVACLALVAILAPLALRHGIRITTRWLHAAAEGETGLAAYELDPRWQRALALDTLLPPAAVGAILGEPDYLQLDYCLYPRRLYPADPTVVAGTWHPWRAWEHEAEVPLSYRWVVGPQGSLARPHPE